MNISRCFLPYRVKNYLKIFLVLSDNAYSTFFRTMITFNFWHQIIYFAELLCQNNVTTNESIAYPHLLHLVVDIFVPTIEENLNATIDIERDSLFDFKSQVGCWTPLNPPIRMINNHNWIFIWRYGPLDCAWSNNSHHRMHLIDFSFERSATWHVTTRQRRMLTTVGGHNDFGWQRQEDANDARGHWFQW